MIIDAHMHLWNKVEGKLGNKKVSPVKNGVIRVGTKSYQGMPSWFSDCRNTVELAVAAFDDAGVDAAVVTQEYLDGNQNQYLLKVKKKYPDRFFVHGLIDFTRPKVLKEQFKKIISQGFKGVKCPAMFLPQLKRPVRLDEPAVMWIWEQMADKNMILSIDLAPGNVQTGQMKRIIKTFPGLKIAIGHFGMVGHDNWMSQIHLAESENVFIECGGIIWLHRQEGPQFKKAQAKIKQVVHAIGANKIMWGSDYPRTMVDFTYRQSMEFVTKGCNFLTEKEKKAFLGDNAAKLYGFKYNRKKLKPRTRITEL